MPSQGGWPPEPRFFEVRVKVWCATEDAVRLSNQIGNLLCPNDEHDGPCEIPWDIDLDELPLDEVPSDLRAEITNFHPGADLGDGGYTRLAPPTDDASESRQR